MRGNLSDDLQLRRLEERFMTYEKEIDQHMAFLSRYIFETSTFSEYLELCGGIPRMQDLRRREWLIE